MSGECDILGNISRREQVRESKSERGNPKNGKNQKEDKADLLFDESVLQYLKGIGCRLVSGLAPKES